MLRRMVLLFYFTPVLVVPTLQKSFLEYVWYQDSCWYSLLSTELPERQLNINTNLIIFCTCSDNIEKVKRARQKRYK